MTCQNLRLMFGGLLLAVTIGYSPAVFADKGGNGHGKGKSEGHDKVKGKQKHEGDNDSREKHAGGKVIIENADRILIRKYVAENYRSNCPPGLAKKNNGCLPPGQAKKRYVIGEPLLVGWEPVPRALLVQLRPVPAGYQYVQMDKDVLLISEASHKVIDAITLMSAVGN